MSLDADGAIEGLPVRDITRYEALGLIANPFVVPADADEDPAVASEIVAAGNLLLKAILERSRDDAPKPLVVLKAEVPAQYALQAMGTAEPFLATDEKLSVLYAYVPLFTMRVGAVRATLSVIAERLAFRGFQATLIPYVGSILGAPDESLPSFTVLGPDALAQFASRFETDAAEAVSAVFGAGELELHPELSAVADLRQVNLVDEDESDVSAEVDASVGDAPGTAMASAAAQANLDEAARTLFDYFAEYTAVHLSPVIARSLRVYRDRGLAAFAAELRVTKAPRKTLSAILQLSQLRFRKCAFIYDGFESWLEVPDDTRSRLMGALSELRWKTSGLAFPVFVLAPGEAPEIEETFGASGSIAWDFPGLVPMQEDRGVLLPEVVEFWLSSAAIVDGPALSLADPVLAHLAEAADGSMREFVRTAHAAVESAAERGAIILDDEALRVGLGAGR